KFTSRYLFDAGAMVPRPDKALDIIKIAGERTWFTGYISKASLDKEARYADRLIRARTEENTRAEVLKGLEEEHGGRCREIFDAHLELATKYVERFQPLHIQVEEAQSTALSNTEVYLTWDYMDVYVATS